MTLKKIGGPLLGLTLSGCMLLMLFHPEASLTAALRGLAIWWDVLFPSLFPFFVISEIMLGLGIVHLFGALLDPLMRPLFGIPGSGGFVAAMGYVSGYPVGAKLTAKLREQNLISKVEGERLVAFTTSSDPIFLLGAVSVGFFRDASLGLILALSHYGGGLMVGLLMSLHSRKTQSTAAIDPVTGTSIPPNSSKQKLNRVHSALLAMAEARRKDGRSFGELLKGAIQSSLQLIIVVGGLVVFFNVLMVLLDRTGILSTLFTATGQLVSLVGWPPELAQALISGFFEVTIGARSAGEAASAIPLQYKVAAAAFILSWGGLSVHAQVASILNGTGLRYMPFFTARLIHAILASGLVLLLWKPVVGTALSSTWLTLPASASFTSPTTGITASLALLCLILATALLVSFLIPIIMKMFQWMRRN